MLLDNYKKESPIVGVAGIGGGINSYIFLSGGDDPYIISRSLRFNPGDTAFLNRNFSAGNRRKYTLSFWIKLNQTGVENTIFGHMVAGYQTQTQIRVEGTGKLDFGQFTGQWDFQKITTRLLRDLSSWYHIVYEVDTTLSTADDRIKLYINGERETSFSTNTNPSQNLETLVNSNVEHGIGRVTPVQQAVGGNYYLADYHFVDGQALSATDFGSTDDDGVWQPKKFSGSHGTNGFHLDFKDNSSNAALGYDAAGSNNWTVNNLTASPSANAIDLDGNDQIEYPGPGDGISGDFTMECFFLMDPSASGYQRIFSTKEDSYSDEQTMIRRHTNGNIQWYCGNSSPSDHEGPTISANDWHHAALVRSGSTVSYYYNGSRLSTDTYSTSFDITKLVVGGGYGSEQFNGDVHGARFTLGQALYSGSSYTVPTSPITTTSQGATASNVKVLAGTTSTVNQNVGTLGNGTNSGDPTSITSYPFGPPANTDSLLDSPSQNVADQTDSGLGAEITGNYATLNPLEKHADITLSNGNLEASTSSNWKSVLSTIGMASGKWYWEFSPNDDAQIGVCGNSTTRLNSYLESDPTAWVLQTSNGSVYTSSSGQVNTGVTWAAGDIVNVAYDRDTTSLWFGKNGTWVLSGNPAGGTNAVVTNAGPGSTGRTMMVGLACKTGSGYVINFGSRPFAYTAPTGFKCLTVENLATPTIADGSKYFDTFLYTGDGASSRNLTLPLAADFLWIKKRSAVNSHQLVDTVRGDNSVLHTNSTNDARNPQTQFTGGGISSISGTTATLSSGTSNNDNVNANNSTLVGWAWDAGDDANPTTIAAGSLNSSAYDQSQTWSNSLTSSNGFAAAATQGFDGNTSNPAASQTGGTLTFAPNLTIPANSTIEGWFGYSSTDSNATMRVTVNGVVNNSVPGDGWRTLNYNGATTLTSFTVFRDGSTNSADLRGIKINGKILLDSGVTPPTNVPSIESTVRANQTAGFSICTYSGSGSNGTWAHGLLTAPDLIIVKSRSHAQNWAVQHSALGPTYYAYLQTTNEFRTSSGTAFWNDTAPTNATVSVGTDNDTNSSGKTYVAYSFSTIPGYSSFGKYIGNGDPDGIFIYTGFSPSWLLFKRSDSSSDWSIYDTARDPHNVAGDKLEPNTNDDESEQGTVIDILSNGFKFRRNSLENGGNDVYVYAAFASHPFNSSRAR